MEQINLPPDMLEKAKAAKSAEDLKKFAQENGVVLTDEQAQRAFESLNASGALTGDELEAVAGGPTGCRVRKKKQQSC